MQPKNMLYIQIALLLMPFLLIQQSLSTYAATPFAIGFNTSGITNYGYSDILPYSHASDVDADLTEIKHIGGTVLRIYAANKYISDSDAAQRLAALLDKAALYNISVIVSLIDYYDSGFGPQGITYTRCDFNPCLLGDDFFSSGYQTRFKSFVSTIVQANKQHPNIYAWEIGNELKDEKNTPAFISFMSDMSAYIHSLDQAHPVATGMINAGHTGLTPATLYPNLPNIAIITIHAYNGDRNGLPDVQWAVANGKKVVLEEGLADGTGDRSSFYTSELNYWKSQGIAAFLQWGFLAKGLSDNGNGDRNSGMDTIFHTDYDALVRVFQALLPDTTPPAVSIIQPANNSQLQRNSKITITASAIDNTGVSKVEFYVNKQLLCTDTTAAYTCIWSVPAKKGVSYTIEARVYDGAGNVAANTITVSAK